MEPPLISGIEQSRTPDPHPHPPPPPFPPRRGPERAGAPPPAVRARGARVHHPRPRTYDLEHVRLDLAIDLEERSVAGRASLRLSPIVPALARVALDAVDLEIAAVRVDGKAVATDYDGSTLRVEVAPARPVGAPISIEVD